MLTRLLMTSLCSAAMLLTGVAVADETTAPGYLAQPADPDPAFSKPVAIGSIVPGLTQLKLPVRTWRDMRYNNMVRQERDFTCGAAALATILQNVFGSTTRENEIIEDMLMHTDAAVVQQRGFSLLDMKSYVERVGLRGRGYKIDANSLRAIKIPVIALQNVRGYSHFVVIKHVEGSTIYIADPALGNRQMPLEEFTPSWNGIVFAVVGDGIRQENALLESSKSVAAHYRAGLATRVLPQQQEFGLVGLDSF